MCNAPDHLLTRSRCCRPAVVQHHALRLLPQARISIIPVAVKVLMCSNGRDIPRSKFENGCHFLVKQLVLMVNLVLLFFLHPVLATRSFEQLA